MLFRLIELIGEEQPETIHFQVLFLYRIQISTSNSSGSVPVKAVHETEK